MLSWCYSAMLQGRGGGDAHVDARILVVADIPVLHRSAVQALELAGCAAIGVDSFAEAADVAAVSAPNVLVVEGRLMRMDPAGFLALRQAESLRRSRIVALGLLAARRALIEMGADCVVGKPFTDRELVVGVEWAIGVYA